MMKIKRRREPNKEKYLRKRTPRCGMELNPLFEEGIGLRDVIKGVVISRQDLSPA